MKEKKGLDVSVSEAKLDWIRFAISNILRLTILVAALQLFWEGLFFTGFLALLVLFTMYLPAIIEKNYKVTFTIEIEFLVLFFLYGTLFLGEFRDYYLIYPWWDGMLHTLSGVILGIMAFVMVYILDREKRVKLDLSPGLMALFAFSFAMAVGAIWEIFEFGMDQIFGLTMQEDGLVDTMMDLIVDGIGALFASTVGYFHLKKRKLFLLNRFILRFIDKNPELFHKKRTVKHRIKEKLKKFKRKKKNN